jgi:hypothetical protein
VTGVIVAFLVDAVFVATLLFASAWRVRRGGYDTDRAGPSHVADVTRR